MGGIEGNFKNVCGLLMGCWKRREMGGVICDCGQDNE